MEARLIQIGEHKRKALVDIIFIHGLGGDPLGTWHPNGERDSDDSWLLWLSQDISEGSIWTLDYDVEPSAWRGQTMPLVDRATNILSLLDSDEIGARSIIFVAHSLGGLLVKQMLRHALDFGDPRWQLIARNTKGIVFISTPHSGSDLANWVSYFGPILRTTTSVHELEAHHSRLRELNILYRNHEILSNIPIQIYCEKKKTKGLLVVNETSADPGIKGVTPIPLDEDHISICRPRSRNTQIYKRVRRLIHESLINSQASSIPRVNSSANIVTIDNRRIGNYIGSKSIIQGSVVSRNYYDDQE